MPLVELFPSSFDAHKSFLWFFLFVELNKKELVKKNRAKSIKFQLNDENIFNFLRLLKLFLFFAALFFFGDHLNHTLRAAIAEERESY